MNYSLQLHDTEVAIRNLILRILESEKLTRKLLLDLDVLVQDFTDEQKEAPGSVPESL